MSAGKGIGRQRELPKYDLDRNHAPVPTAKLAKRQCFRRCQHGDRLQVHRRCPRMRHSASRPSWWPDQQHALGDARPETPRTTSDRAPSVAPPQDSPQAAIGTGFGMSGKILLLIVDDGTFLTDRSNLCPRLSWITSRIDRVTRCGPGA